MAAHKLILRATSSVHLGQPTITLCTVLYIVWRYLQRRSYEHEAMICTAQDGLPDTQLISSMMCRAASFMCLFAANVMFHRFTSLCIQTSHRDILMQYLSLKHQALQRIGAGAIHCLVFRRAGAIVDFLESLISSAIPKIGSLAITLTVLGKHLPGSIVLGMAVNGGVFIVMALWAQRRRARVRQSINSLYEESNAKRLDILANYERIIAYGGLEEEVNKYYASLEKYTQLKQVYEMSHGAIGLASALFLLLLSVYAISELGTSTRVSEDVFSAAVLLIEQLKESIYYLLRDIDNILTAYSNLQHSGFGRRDIEDNSKVQLDVFEKSIVLHNVSVSVGSNTPLKGLSLVVTKGERIAIVGASGSGKSLFIRAVAGLLEYEGSIAIDGFEVCELGRSTVSRLVSYVSQSISMFDSTILDNLRAGNRSISEEEVVDVCRTFDCHSLFAKLGYQKRVGDGGRYLSGGLRQRVALMRAIIRNTQILALDGAFNGLDQTSERSFVQHIKNHLGDKTVMCVVQSPDLLASFDRVLFFSEGRLEAGSFEDLCRGSQEFRSFCSLE